MERSHAIGERRHFGLYSLSVVSRPHFDLTAARQLSALLYRPRLDFFPILGPWVVCESVVHPDQGLIQTVQRVHQSLQTNL